MIPFVEQPVLRISDSIQIHLFGPLVVTGVLLGMRIARGRVERTGLDSTFGEHVMFSAVFVGFLVAHAFDMIAYHPQRALENPLELLKFWGSMSSYGGMLGGLAGIAWALFTGEGRKLDLRKRLGYVDAIAYGFPFAWVFGRLGCTFALDHPGSVTDWPIATSLATPGARAFITRVYADADRLADLPGVGELPSLGFHNLGFYELLYTVAVIVPVFLVLGRSPRAPGFFLVTFLLVYSPVRFFMDFLRLGDRTYAGLTPAQHIAIGVTLASLALAIKLRTDGPRAEA